ncbi:hypothetical protein GGI21_005009 [Coemansia aciculifera]|nr:hypothetical protein GGI21_005009 [Coemansia aciculifera]
MVKLTFTSNIDSTFDYDVDIPIGKVGFTAINEHLTSVKNFDMELVSFCHTSVTENTGSCNSNETNFKEMFMEDKDVWDELGGIKTLHLHLCLVFNAQLDVINHHDGMCHENVVRLDESWKTFDWASDASQHSTQLKWTENGVETKLHKFDMRMNKSIANTILSINSNVNLSRVKHIKVEIFPLSN